MYDRFDGISQIGYPGYIDNIYENISMYIDWGFLNIGGFQNVEKNKTVYGQDPSRLRRVTNGTYTDGRVWESYRKGWVWESGLYSHNPLYTSGVYINNTFYPHSTSGTYAHQVNYRDGQIIFNNPLPTGTLVQVEHSYKLYEIYNLDREPWFQDVIQGEWVQTYPDFTQASSGQFNVLAQNRVTLPFIGVEVIPRRSFKPLQLGGGQIVDQDIQFWICGKNAWQVNTALDAISFQNDSTLRFFNIKFIQDVNKHPYNYNGTLNPSGKVYKELINECFWKKVRLKNTSLQKVADAPLYISVIKMTLEADFEEI